jgi:hypothetical protein
MPSSQSPIFISILFYFLVFLGFELRVSNLLAGTLPLEPLRQPFFVLVIFETRSLELFVVADFES